jgi:hypothetical protein
MNDITIPSDLDVEQVAAVLRSCATPMLHQCGPEKIPIVEWAITEGLLTASHVQRSTTLRQRSLDTYEDLALTEDGRRFVAELGER